MDRPENKNKELFRKWNPGILTRLTKQGVDLALPTRLVNVFYVSRREHVTKVSACLKEIGMDIMNVFEPEETDNPDSWAIHAVIKLKPALTTVHEMTDACVDLAAQMGADYDGWYTEV